MKRMAFLWLVCALLLSGCALKEPPLNQEIDWGLWFAADVEYGAQSAALGREDREWEEEPLPQELMTELLRGPTWEGLRSPFPSGVAVRSITSLENGVLLVDLTEQYGGLSGMKLTMADSCIALTLCQLPQVEAVRITVEGRAIPYRSRQELGMADVLLQDVSEAPDSLFTVLYFPRRDGTGLLAEYRQVERKDGRLAELLAAELLRGPEREYGAALPEGTQVRSLTVDSGLCRLDLSAEFLVNAPKSDAQAALVFYAVVNTLCALQEVDRVQLLVEGELLSVYGGVAANVPQPANHGLLRSD